MLALDQVRTSRVEISILRLRNVVEISTWFLQLMLDRIRSEYLPHQTKIQDVGNGSENENERCNKHVIRMGDGRLVKGAK